MDANLPAAAEASGHGVRSRQPGMLARRRRIRNVRSADTRPEHTRPRPPLLFRSANKGPRHNPITPPRSGGPLPRRNSAKRGQGRLDPDCGPQWINTVEQVQQLALSNGGADKFLDRERQLGLVQPKVYSNRRRIARVHKWCNCKPTVGRPKRPLNPHYISRVQVVSEPPLAEFESSRPIKL